MSELVVSNDEKSVLQGLSSKEFRVKKGDLLKIRVTAIDEASVVNSKALVCQIEFFDSDGQPIQQAVDGVSVSAVYGSYVYIESIVEGQSAQWAKEVIGPPGNAYTLRLTLHAWKSSPQLRIEQEIECLDLRRVTAQEVTGSIAPKISHSEEYEILPFWQITYSVELLRKIDMPESDFSVLVSFLDSKGNALETQASANKSVAGGMLAVESTQIGLTLSAVSQPCEYDGYQKGIACIQSIPPSTAVTMRIVIHNYGALHPIWVSQRFRIFESLIESRLTAHSGSDICRCESLPLALAKLSLARIEEKFPDKASVYEDGLQFYSEHGLICELNTYANQILNRFQDVNLLSKARHALAIALDLNPAWKPVVGKSNAHVRTGCVKQKQKKVVHLLQPVDGSAVTSYVPQAIDVIAKQGSAAEYSACVITPLGYPARGNSGNIWEASETESIRYYHLNCISYEDLRTVPLTTQLNFMALLVKQILIEENADIIHAHEGTRGYDLALVGLALSDAMQLPLVYERRLSIVPQPKQLCSGQTLGLARLEQEYRCLREAHAVIISFGVLQECVQECEIDSDKIFLLPELPADRIASDEEIEMHIRETSAVYHRAYQYAWRTYRG